MKHATYVGVVPELRGEGALVRPSNQAELVLAQFDRIGLTCGDRFFSDASGMSTFGRWRRDEWLKEKNDGYRDAGDAPGFRTDVSRGWHEFPAEEFVFDD